MPGSTVRWTAPTRCPVVSVAINESGLERVSGILSDWELWACAHEEIRQHGFDAPIHAAMRADELLEGGDLNGAKNWRLIVHRINQLLLEPAPKLH